MHEHIDPDVRTIFDCGCSTNPGKVDEGVTGNFLAPNGRIGKDKTSDDFHGNRDDDHGIKNKQQTAFAVLIQEAEKSGQDFLNSDVVLISNGQNGGRASPPPHLIRHHGRKAGSGYLPLHQVYQKHSKNPRVVF